MTNVRHPHQMAERVAELDLGRRAGSTAACAVPDCRQSSAGVLCQAHWFALPWAVRNDAGAAHEPPARASKAWLRGALRTLRPRASYRATTSLTVSEERFRPVALRLLAEHEPRPKTTGECLERGIQHPCPYVSCPRHLYLGVTEAGTLKLNFPGKEVWELEETCASHVARRGGVSAAQAGALVGLKRGRVGQMERAFRVALRARGVG